MALNTAHANGGVLIHAGECILLFCDNVQMEFAGQVNTAGVYILHLLITICDQDTFAIRQVKTRI